MNNNCLNAANSLIQIVTSSTSSLVTCSTTMALDDTIPQNTEGDEILTATITPTNVNNLLEIEFTCFIHKDANAGARIVALFQDATLNALCAVADVKVAASRGECIYLHYTMTAGTTSATTFKIRIGGVTADLYVNGDSTGRLMGGVGNTRLTIKEFVS